MSKKEKNPKYVTTDFCDERVRRVEEKIDSIKTTIINAINEKNGMPWSAKASIIGSFVLSVSSIIVAIITVLG